MAHRQLRLDAELRGFEREAVIQICHHRFQRPLALIRWDDVEGWAPRGTWRQTFPLNLKLKIRQSVA